MKRILCRRTSLCEEMSSVCSGSWVRRSDRGQVTVAQTAVHHEIREAGRDPEAHPKCNGKLLLSLRQGADMIQFTL